MLFKDDINSGNVQDLGSAQQRAMFDAFHNKDKAISPAVWVLQKQDLNTVPIAS